MSNVVESRESRAGRTSGLEFRALTSKERIDDVVLLAKEAHEESRFSYIDFAPHKVVAIVERALSDPKRHAVMLAWKDGKPVGGAYCSIGEYHIGTGVLLTTIHNINVLREVRYGLYGGRVALGLFRGVETWSQARSSKEILFHATSDVNLPNTHKLVKRLGFKLVGGSYVASV